MASTIFSNLSPTPEQQPNQPQVNPGNSTISGMVNNLVGQITNSLNPQQTFNDLVSRNPNYKNGLDIINQYGNGDPKAAFFNYAQSMGKADLAKQILSNLGLQ